MIEAPEKQSQDIQQERVKRDPAIGSSALPGSIADSMGFSFFPRPATLLLP